MESNIITNKDKDYSNNPLYNSEIKQPHFSGIIYNLNNSQNNNDEKPNSTKVSLKEEENNIEHNIPFNNNRKKLPISPSNTYKEKIKIDNYIPNISSDTKLNNYKFMKNNLQEYLQKGYKKYPHAKNEREIIQHYEFWEGCHYFPYGGHILEGP